MKKWIIPAICAVSILFLLATSFSGHKGAAYTSIGVTHNKFLFIPAKSAHFNVTFRNPYTGTLTLIDEDGKSLSSKKYTITVDGRNTGPSFSVKDKQLVRISIRCTKAVSPGKQYIRVKGGGPLVTHVYFKHHLNPLAVWLSWTISLLAVVSLVWFLVLRRMFYPQFKSCQKTIFVPNQVPLSIKLTGARMVVISSEKKKQSIWEELLKGPVVYKVHPSFISPIVLSPVKGGRILAKVDSSIYRVSPNPMPRIGTAAIDNVQTNVHITIN